MTQITPLEARTLPQSGSTPAPAAPRPLAVEMFGTSDRGRLRPTNEDQFVTAVLMRALWVQQSSVPQSGVQYSQARGHLFMVADGVGGARGGEQASALAMGAVEMFLLNGLAWLLALDGPAEATVLHDFKAAIRSADACVYAAASHNPKLAGMGTTLTLAYSRDADLFLAHAGSSRCYLFRDDALHQLTHDDTLVQEMVETGLVAPENAARHALRHVVTNVLGGSTQGVHTEVHQMRLEPSDVLLLCTDGLTRMVSDERIAAVLRSSTGPRDACEQLTRLANERGGEDNVTVVIGRYS